VTIDWRQRKEAYNEPNHAVSDIRTDEQGDAVPSNDFYPITRHGILTIIYLPILQIILKFNPSS